jgi:hypothetical protein
MTQVSVFLIVEPALCASARYPENQRASSQKKDKGSTEQLQKVTRL